MKTIDEAWAAWLATLPASVRENIEDVERNNSRAYTHEAFTYAWFASEDNNAEENTHVAH